MSPSAADRQLSSLRELPADGLPEAVERAEAAVAVRNALWDGDEAAYHKEWQAAVGRADGRTRMGVRLAQAWWFGPQGADASDEVPADDPWHQTVTELSRFWYRSGNEASTAAAERLLRNCRLDDDSLEALMTAVLALVHANRMDDAETWWRSLKAEADRRGAVTWQAVLTGMWASAVLRAGDVTYAAELARHALSLLPAQDWGAAIGDPLATLLFAWTAAGSTSVPPTCWRVTSPTACRGPSPASGSHGPAATTGWPPGNSSRRSTTSPRAAGCSPPAAPTCPSSHPGGRTSPRPASCSATSTPPGGSRPSNSG